MNEGIKVSQVGYDVKTAGDTQLLFSSSWPLLKIIYEGDFIISSDSNQTIYTHGLGYPPAFFICDNTQGFSQSNPGLDLFIGVNNNELKYFSSTGAVTLPTTIHYYIYDLDLTSNFLSPIVQQSLPSQGGSGDFGVKISKDGKDVSSTDLRDFTVHSGTQSPMIHQVLSTVTQTTNSGGGNIDVILANHNLGYLALFFSFAAGANGYYSFRGSFSQSLPRIFGTINYIRFELAAANSFTGKACLIVFKDPYILDVPQIIVSA